MELKDVNIFPGRFQPFHKGHLKCCEDAYKKNGLPTYIMYIHNEKFDAKKPFDDDLTKKELERLVEKYDYIAGINWIRRPMPVTICRVCMENGFRPVLWLCGADRIDGYKKLMQGKSIKDELGIDEPEFMETNRYYSSTEVRNAIKQDDEEKFKEFMPQEAHNLYKEFKAQLDKINENALTLTKYIINKDMKNIKDILLTESKTDLESIREYTKTWTTERTPSEYGDMLEAVVNGLMDGFIENGSLTIYKKGSHEEEKETKFVEIINNWMEQLQDLK